MATPRFITEAEAQQDDINRFPYVDVTLSPIQLTTLPFYDPELSGTGLPTGLNAPGENLIVVPLMVDAWPSTGTKWGLDPNPYFYYTDVPLGNAEGQTYLIDDTSTLTDVNPGSSDKPNFFSPRRTTFASLIPAVPIISNVPSTVINAPLVLATDVDVSSGGFGNRSLTYRIYYQIIPVIVPSSRYFLITAVDQGTKTFTVTTGDYDGSVVDGTMTIEGSTGNNGTYAIVSATFDTDHTDIVVTESIPDDTADGWVKQ